MLTTSTMSELETKLFQEWESKRERFSPDGLVDEAAYLRSHPRILLVLKETNSGDGEGIDLKGFLANGARSGDDKTAPPRTATWDNVTRWVHGLRNLDKEFFWDQMERKWTEQSESNGLNDLRDELLKTICVMNVKKSSGGHTANNDELADAAVKDKGLLKRQYEIYASNEHTRPHWVIGGGSVPSNLFAQHVLELTQEAWQRTTRGIYYALPKGGSVFIYFSHPAARVDDSYLYYALIDAAKEIKQKHGV